MLRLLRRNADSIEQYAYVDNTSIYISVQRHYLSKIYKTTKSKTTKKKILEREIITKKKAQ